MVSTIDEARTPSELAEWLRVWANGYEDGDALDDNDARQIADAVVRVCAPCNAAVTREALMKAKLYFDHRGEGTNLDDAGMAIDAITSIDAALAAHARNCDVGKADDLHASFVRHCDACDPPGGCCHRKDPRGMLDTNCASILKCFARFAIANKEGDKK